MLGSSIARSRSRQNSKYRWSASSKNFSMPSILVSFLRRQCFKLLISIEKDHISSHVLEVGYPQGNRPVVLQISSRLMKVDTLHSCSMLIRITHNNLLAL